MLRRVVVGTLVAASMGLASPPGAQGVSDASSAERRPTSIKTVVREYGDGPVRVERGQLLKLRFEGRKGDRVGLAATRARGRMFEELRGRLRLAGRKPEGSFFTLPRSGRFTFSYRASLRVSRDLVQLVRQQRVEADPSRRLRLPARRGTMYVVGVRAPKSGLTVASFGDTAIRDLDSSLEASRLQGVSRIVLGDGLARSAAGSSIDQVRPGERVWVPLAPSGAADVRVGPITKLATSVDGAPVQLSDSALGYDVSFEASAGQELHAWVAASPMVHADLTSGMSLWTPGAAPYQHNQFGLFEVATGGTQHAIFLPEGAGRDTEFSVDSLVEGPPIQVGPVSTYAPSPDGRWTVATITGGDYELLWLTNPTAPDWQVVVGDPFSGLAPECSEPSGNSCGEQYYKAGGNGITDVRIAEGNRLVLATPPGATGTVNVRLTTYDY